MLWTANECDIVTFADNNKVLCVNSEKIPQKSTKSTQGVQVMKLTKKNSKMCRMVLAKNCEIHNLNHYSTKNIPAAGSFLRDADTEEKQITLFDE